MLVRLRDDHAPIDALRPDFLPQAVGPIDHDPSNPVVVAEAKGEGLLRLRHESHRRFHDLGKDAPRGVHFNPGAPGVALASCAHQVDSEPGMARFLGVAVKPGGAAVLGDDDIKVSSSFDVRNRHSPSHQGRPEIAT